MRRPYLAGLLTGIGAVSVVLLVVLLFWWLDEEEPLALPGDRNSTRPGPNVYIPPMPVPPRPGPPPPDRADFCARILPHVAQAIALLGTLPTLDPDVPTWKGVHETLQTDTAWAPAQMKPYVQVVDRAIAQALYSFEAPDPQPFIQVKDARVAAAQLERLCNGPVPTGPATTPPPSPTPSQSPSSSPSPSPSEPSDPPDVRL